MIETLLSKDTPKANLACVKWVEKFGTAPYFTYSNDTIKKAADAYIAAEQSLTNQPYQKMKEDITPQVTYDDWFCAFRTALNEKGYTGPICREDFEMDFMGMREPGEVADEFVKSQSNH